MLYALAEVLLHVISGLGPRKRESLLFEYFQLLRQKRSWLLKLPPGRDTCHLHSHFIDKANPSALPDCIPVGKCNSSTGTGTKYRFEKNNTVYQTTREKQTLERMALVNDNYSAQTSW